MTRNPEDKTSQLRLLGIATLAVALRLTLVLVLPRVIRWDEPDYLWLGRNLWSGHGYTVAGEPELHYTPLFPVLAGGLSLILRDPEWGSNVWFVALGALLVVPVYAIARRVYGERAGLAAAFLAAIFPGLSTAELFWGTMTEPLFIFLVYCGIWACMAALRDGRLWGWALAGALFGLAYLARPEGIVWMAVFGAFAALSALLAGRLLRWCSIGRLALYGVAFVVVAAPYTVFLHRYTGKWMATGKLAITYQIGEAVVQHDPALYDEVTASLDANGEILWWSDRRFESGLLEVLLRDPRRAIERAWTNLRRAKGAVLAPNVFPLFLLALIVLGWLRHPWDRRRLTGESLLAMSALPVLAFVPFHVEVRFFAPAFPVLLIWVASGLCQFSAWWGETLGSWRADADTQVRAPVPEGMVVGWAPLTILVLGVSAYMGLAHWRTIRSGMPDLAQSHKQVGLWLKANVPASAAVLARDTAVTLYAERRHVASPRAEYGSYLDYARRKGASYIVVDEYELRVLRPHLAFLMDDAAPPAELQPVYASEDARGRTIVYSLKVHT